MTRDTTAGYPLVAKDISVAFEILIRAIAEEDTFNTFTAILHFDNAPLFEYFTCVQIGGGSIFENTECDFINIGSSGKAGNGTVSAVVQISKSR